jgi:hypothetical protein
VEPVPVELSKAVLYAGEFVLSVGVEGDVGVVPVTPEVDLAEYAVEVVPAEFVAATPTRR